MLKIFIISLLGFSFFAHGDDDKLIGESIFNAFHVNQDQLIQQNVNDQTLALTKDVYLDFRILRVYKLKIVGLKLKGINDELFRFSLDEKDRITEVTYFNLFKDAAEVALCRLRPHSIVDALATKFQISLLCDETQDKNIQKLQSIGAVKENRIEELQRHRVEREEILDSRAGYLVEQHEFTVLRYDSRNGISALKTDGIGPCIGLAIYDPSQKIGLLAHFDSLTEIQESMELISEAFEKEGGSLKNPDRKPTLYLVGGNYYSFDNVERLLEILKSFEIELKMDLLSGQTESIWLDLKNGRVFRYQRIDALYVQPRQTWLKNQDYLSQNKYPLIEVGF